MWYTVFPAQNVSQQTTEIELLKGEDILQAKCENWFYFRIAFVFWSQEIAVFENI
jgi:hypothetical protein